MSHANNNNNINNVQENRKDYDECSVNGICSMSPTMAAMKSAILAYLQELAFYILRIRGLGARNNKIKNDFIEIFSVLISNSEYSEENLQQLVAVISSDIEETRLLYKNLCENNGVPAKYYKTRIKLKQNPTYSDIIKLGQNYTNEIKKNLSDEQRNGFDLLTVILKSIFLYIVELNILDVDVDAYYLKLLSALIIRKPDTISIERMKELINQYSHIDYELMEKLFIARKNEFGELIKTNVNLATRPGKAVLVAGNNIKELELFLEATKDKGIDVYTHGQMVAGHTFAKLKAYPHLVGHYGQGAEYFISDFAKFPGSIFLTKLSLFKVEQLYSSRIFTTDKIAPKGLSTIKNYNFEPLIHSALASDGFENAEPEKFVQVGVIEEEFDNYLREMENKIDNKEIKYIFNIGIASTKISTQGEYFKKFLSLLTDECFLFTCSYKTDLKNLIYLNLDYAFPFLYRILNAFLPKKQNNPKLKLNVFSTRCEPHTVPALVNLRNMGCEVYFNTCPPTLINPALLDFLIEKFCISRYENPELDFKKMTT